MGLPNIGKSTLFNAMTRSSQAKTGNFPFCTINANLAKVDVYDDRSRQLAKFTGAPLVYDVKVDLADVAGLIAGAHKGEGLGNKFLADIRPCTTILHMVRCFTNEREGFDVPDPLGSIATIEAELVLSDLEALEKRVTKLMKTKKASDPDLDFSTRLKAHLEEGKPARDFKLSKGNEAFEKGIISEVGLLSTKPTLLVLNVDDASVAQGNKFSKLVEEKFGVENTVRVCSLIEEQTAQFDREERLAFLDEYDIKEPSVDVLLRKVFAQLKLQSFFTVGPKMVKAWSIPQNTVTRDAAGEIHTDFKKYFHHAKVLPWDEFLKHKNLSQAEAAMRSVDGEEVMKDGDVFIVEHNTPGKK